MAAIGSAPFERGEEAEGFLIVTSKAGKGLVDIHDSRLMVLSLDCRILLVSGVAGINIPEWCLISCNSSAMVLSVAHQV
jgi:hypothetical protein